MPSAIQVKENEKRKHASLTIVEARLDFALRIGKTKRMPRGGALVGRVLGSSARQIHQRKERKWFKG
jgi:hypothetical protein